jgi:hypothetical protein
MDYSGIAQNSNIISGCKCLWVGDFDMNTKVKFANPKDKKW